MEFASLGDLEQQHLLKPFKPEETELVVYQALHAISHMHGCGITHHDIKPENILVSSSPCPAIDTRRRCKFCFPCSRRDSLATHNDFVSRVAYFATAVVASDC